MFLQRSLQNGRDGLLLAYRLSPPQPGQVTRVGLMGAGSISPFMRTRRAQNQCLRHSAAAGRRRTVSRGAADQQRADEAQPPSAAATATTPTERIRSHTRAAPFPRAAATLLRRFRDFDPGRSGQLSGAELESALMDLGVPITSAARPPPPAPPIQPFRWPRVTTLLASARTLRPHSPAHAAGSHSLERIAHTRLRLTGGGTPDPRTVDPTVDLYVPS